MTLIGLTGCPAADDDSPNPETPPGPIDGNSALAGTESASAPGAAALPDPGWLIEHEEGPGRPVTVTVTVAEGYITTVVIDAPDETPIAAGRVIANAPAAIKAKNSFDIQIDGQSGATRTTDAIKKAGEDALQKIIDAAR